MNTRAALIVKLIFVMLIVFVVVEVIVGLKVLNQPKTPQSAAADILRSQSGGKITLTADKATYNVGDNIKVAARIFTGGHPSDGTDLIISYDSNFLEATSSGLTRGTIYNDYPAMNISAGKIIISGISSNLGFNGQGVLANLNLKAKQLGKTPLVISFIPSDTRDSNIIESKTGQDILDEVSNLEINITGVSSEVAGSCSSRTYQVCTDASGKSGTYWCGNIKDGPSCSIGCFKQKTGKELGCNVI